MDLGQPRKQPAGSADQGAGHLVSGAQEGRRHPRNPAAGRSRPVFQRRIRRRLPAGVRHLGRRVQLCRAEGSGRLAARGAAAPADRREGGSGRRPAAAGVPEPVDGAPGQSAREPAGADRGDCRPQRHAGGRPDREHRRPPAPAPGRPVRQRGRRAPGAGASDRRPAADGGRSGRSLGRVSGSGRTAHARERPSGGGACHLDGCRRQCGRFAPRRGGADGAPGGRPDGGRAGHAGGRRAAGGHAHAQQVPVQAGRGNRHRAAGQLRHAGLAVGPGGGHRLSAGAGRDLHGHEGDGHRPAAHLAGRADHLARPAGGRRHHHRRDDAGEDASGPGPLPRRQRCLHQHLAAHADWHADHDRRLHADRAGGNGAARVHVRPLRRDCGGHAGVLAGVGAVHALPCLPHAAGAGGAPRRGVRHALLQAPARPGARLCQPPRVDGGNGGAARGPGRRGRKAGRETVFSAHRPAGPDRRNLAAGRQLVRRQRGAGQGHRPPAQRRSGRAQLGELHRLGHAAHLHGPVDRAAGPQCHQDLHPDHRPSNARPPARGSANAHRPGAAAGPRG